MGRAKLVVILLSALVLGLGGTAQAYHLDMIYGLDANYAYAQAVHFTSPSEFSQDTKEDSQAGVAHAHALQVSAESQSWARPPGGTDPVAQINLNVNSQTVYYSYAYGYTDSFGEFTLVKDPGDTQNRALVTLKFTIKGAFNLGGDATSRLSYSLKVDGKELYRDNVTYDASGTRDNSYQAKLVLISGETHTFKLTLDGDLDHSSQTLDDAWYTANLEISDIQPAPPVSMSAILLLLTE